MIIKNIKIEFPKNTGNTGDGSGTNSNGGGNSGDNSSVTITRPSVAVRPTDNLYNV